MSEAEANAAAMTAKLVRNEPAKLGATFFNDIAVAFIVADVIVPLIAFACGIVVPTRRFLDCLYPGMVGNGLYDSTDWANDPEGD